MRSRGFYGHDRRVSSPRARVVDQRQSRLSRRTWYPHDVRVRLASATAFFTLLAIVNSLPLITNMSGFIGEHGDSYFSVWRLAWVAHKLPRDPLHLFDANIFYPHPATLAYSDAMLLPATVLSPLHWLHVHPVAVYNLTLLGAFVASGVAACLLVTH